MSKPIYQGETVVYKTIAGADVTWTLSREGVQWTCTGCGEQEFGTWKREASKHAAACRAVSVSRS